MNKGDKDAMVSSHDDKRLSPGPLKSIFRKRTGYSSRAVRVIESSTADVTSAVKGQKEQSHHWISSKTTLQTTTGEYSEKNGQEISSTLGKSKIRFVDAREDVQKLEGQVKPVDLLKEGWLFKKNLSRTMNKWSKRWFMISEDSVYYIRGGFGGEDLKTLNNKKIKKKKVCNLMLSTVRECDNRGKKSKPRNPKFRFEIITSDGKVYMLQAIDGKSDFNAWIEALRGRIYHLLMDDNSVEATTLTHDDSVEQAEPKPKQYKLKDFSPDDFSDCAFSDTSTQYTDKSGSVTTGCNFESKHNLLQSFDQDENNEDGFTYLMKKSLDSMNKTSSLNCRCSSGTIDRILKENPLCADCGKVGPDWASLNLGVVLCIECSGVHRSLGVHISKVRSLRLDAISESEANILLALGNKNVNSFREDKIDSSSNIEKPNPNSPRAVKEDWIRRKYSTHEKKGSHDENNLKRKVASRTNCAMFDAACECDPVALAKELADGADVHYRNETDGRTALHACILSDPERDKDDMKLNLFWSNSQNEVDGNLEIAYYDHVMKQTACAELLLKNGARISALDNNLENVLDCAYRLNVEKEILDYLIKSYKKANDTK